jgi:MerR family redox-sensitive transcriptional activator SoxR
MTIGQLAAKCGVPTSTIRYYERIDLLPRPERIGGRRRYRSGDVDQVAVLRLAKACGFRLAEIRRLVNGFDPDVPPSQRWRKLAQEKRHELDVQMARLLLMRSLLDRVARCRCVDLTECGRRASSAR